MKIKYSIEKYLKVSGLLFLFLTAGCQNRAPFTLVFTGDVILDGGVAQEMTIRGDSILTGSISRFLQGDINIINIETVLTNQEGPLRDGNRLKYYPAVASLLSNGGVDGASVANNHSFDYGQAGFDETLDALNDAGIITLGDKCEPHVFSKNGKRIAVLAASLSRSNDHLCLNSKESIRQKAIEFRKSHPSTPLVLYIHWGSEYQRKPEKWQEKLAYELIDCGVDAIIGHHPHVFQNLEFYKGKPIAYSLGNFVADAYLPNTTVGAVATIKIEESGLKLSFALADIESYFPYRMEERDQVAILLDNLKFSKDICHYLSENQWIAKPVSEIDFLETSSKWLFHVDNQYGIMVSKLIDGRHKLTLMTNGVAQKSMVLHGELSEIEIADITNNGDMEILLGITKKVNFDQRNKKRLNIFRIEDEGIKTVWLGTRFLHDLESYAVVKNNLTNYLQTVEKDSTGTAYTRTYQWDEFGFALDNDNNIE